MTNALRRIWHERAAFGAWCTVASPLIAELFAIDGFDWVCIELPARVDRLSLDGADAPRHGPHRDDAGRPGPRQRSLCDRQGARCRGAGGDRPDGQHRGGSRAGRGRLPVRAGGHAQHRRRPGRPFSARDNRRGQRRGRIAGHDRDVRGASPTPTGSAARPAWTGWYIGPRDLANGLGVDPGDPDGRARLDEAIGRVLAACRDAGVVPGIHASSGAGARRYADMGFRVVNSTSDTGLIRSGAQRELAAARG